MTPSEDKLDVSDSEKVKLVYSAVITEINRYRDWPIRVLTFTSALHFGIIAAFLLKDLRIVCWAKYGLVAIITILWIYTIYYFVRCHKSYLEARNVQARLQKKMELDTWLSDGEKIIPDAWLKPVEESIWKRKWGWGFYALYATGLYISSVAIILGKIKT